MVKEKTTMIGNNIIVTNKEIIIFAIMSIFFTIIYCHKLDYYLLKLIEFKLFIISFYLPEILAIIVNKIAKSRSKKTTHVFKLLFHILIIVWFLFIGSVVFLSVVLI